jgi:Flp pilus assembly protein TadB
MGDALPVPERMGANVFVSTRGEKETVPKPRKRRKNVDRQFQRAGEEIRGFAARHAKPVLWMLGIAAVVGVALLLVAILLPDGTMIAGIALAGIGFVFMLVGYGVGAYAAFSEDFLWGFLFLVFPIYTAYYLVSNWDEMWRWFLVWSAGAAVLLLAIVVMSAGVEQAEKAKRKAHSSWNGETRQFFAVRSSAAAWGI